MRHPFTRTRVAGPVTALALAAGVLVGAPVVTAPASADPTAGLHSVEHQRAGGAVRSPDGTLERGCQRHDYSYRVNARGHDWSQELFLVDPDGQQIANGYEWNGRDPARGRGQFRFCGQSTQPGRFTVRARLTWEDGAYHERWLERRSLHLRSR